MMYQLFQSLFLAALFFLSDVAFADPPETTCDGESTRVEAVCGEVTLEICNSVFRPRGSDANPRTCRSIVEQRTFSSCAELTNANAKFLHNGACGKGGSCREGYFKRHEIDASLEVNSFAECLVKVRVAARLSKGPWREAGGPRIYCAKLFGVDIPTGTQPDQDDDHEEEP